MIIVAGPTAVGKSGLALRLAERLNGAILSADSRQVYRGFDIGTAKPTPAEQAKVPHYLIDICEPTETLTLADYQQQAQAILAKLHRTGGRMPLLVGGTGLYLRAISKGLIMPKVPPQPALRAQLTQLGQPQCHAFLQQVDPVAAQRIHVNDATRTLRALEVFYATGRPLSCQQGEAPPAYPILHIGLACDPAVLAQRIERRVYQMVEAGFVDEVQTLAARYGADLALLQTLGYAEMQQYLLGKISLPSAIALTAQHTRQFAKRQRTWFRKVPEMEWFAADSPDLLEQVLARVSEFIEFSL
ncbi:MAG: tRNA (adenosine(37)-N6)-dimethylallyltransferase MiaA [Cyanobacteria bacterium J06632_22]